MESDINPTDQHVDQVWDTPSHSEIIELTKAHVEAMEMTNDDLCLLYTSPSPRDS